MDTRKPVSARGVVGVVLAGGRSRRFGVDKARVEVGGEPLVVRTADLLAAVLGEVVIVGDTTLLALWQGRTEEAVRRPMFMDDPREGPLGAVVAVWRRFSRPLVVLACDLPLMDRQTVARLSRPMTSVAVPWVVPEVALGDEGPRRQWLAAHYGAEALHLMATSWDNGERSIGRAAMAAAATLVPGLGPDAVSEAGEATGAQLWDARAFADADTPESLARILGLDQGVQGVQGVQAVTRPA